MSRLSETPDEMLSATSCSVCGAEAAALWQGVEQVRVCPACAIDVLPCLIADAVNICRSPAELAEQVVARFYEALAARHWRERFRR